MQKYIAVEQGLNNVKQALQSAGYQVVDLEQAQQEKVQCAIITGGDENVMGMQTMTTLAPVINVAGMTAQQVLDEIEKYQ